jgi:hypothetical protein
MWTTPDILSFMYYCVCNYLIFIKKNQSLDIRTLVTQKIKAIFHDFSLSLNTEKYEEIFS